MLMCGHNSLTDFVSGHLLCQSQGPDSENRINFIKTFIKELERL